MGIWIGIDPSDQPLLVFGVVAFAKAHPVDLVGTPSCTALQPVALHELLASELEIWLPIDDVVQGS